MKEIRWLSQVTSAKSFSVTSVYLLEMCYKITKPNKTAVSNPQNKTDICEFQLFLDIERRHSKLLGYWFVLVFSPFYIGIGALHFPKKLL